MKADFSKFVGREPTAHLDTEPPKDWRQLEAADPYTACQIRLELAKRKARQLEEEISAELALELKP